MAKLPPHLTITMTFSEEALRAAPVVGWLKRGMSAKWLGPPENGGFRKSDLFPRVKSG